jgi:hypothetical protein
MSPQCGAYTWDEHTFLLYHNSEVFTAFKSAVHTIVCKYNTTLNRSDKNNNEKQMWDLMNVQAIKYVNIGVYIYIRPILTQQFNH